MFYKVKSVEPLDDFILFVTFENGHKKYYDLKPLLNKNSNFKDLKRIHGLFNLVQVDNGGYGISWNENIDLSCNELWKNGIYK